MNYNVIVLSVKTDVERRKHISKVCKTLKLDFEFFNALTPIDLDDDLINTYYSNMDVYQYPELNHKAVFATFESHKEILKRIYTSKQNTLVLEDDLIPVRDYDFTDIDFNSFDLLQLMSEVSCCCHFVNWISAGFLYQEFNASHYHPTQAFDWELHKLRNNFNIQTVDEPVFEQTNNFKSHLAPYGYKKIH